MITRLPSVSFSNCKLNVFTKEGAKAMLLFKNISVIFNISRGDKNDISSKDRSNLSRKFVVI